MFNKILTWLALLLTGISLGAYWFFAGQLGVSPNGSDWANFGSYVGGIFSGLAFLILIYQNYQREIEQKQQSENQRKQDFERTFFMMLEQHNLRLSTLEKNQIISYYYSFITNEREWPKISHHFKGHKREYQELKLYIDYLCIFIDYIRKNKNDSNYTLYSSILVNSIPQNLIFILSVYICNEDEDERKKLLILLNEIKLFKLLDLMVFEALFISSCTNFTIEYSYSIVKGMHSSDPEVNFGSCWHLLAAQCINNISIDELEQNFAYIQDCYKNGKEIIPDKVLRVIPSYSKMYEWNKFVEINFSVLFQLLYFFNKEILSEEYDKLSHLYNQFMSMTKEKIEKKL